MTIHSGSIKLWRSSGWMLAWIVGSLFVACLLSITPLLTGSLQPLKPQWVPLTLLFWLVYAPHIVGVTTCWFLGIMSDLLQGTGLGQHALAYAIMGFITLAFQRRMSLFSAVQQTVVIFLLLSMVLLILFWIQYWVDIPPVSVMYWASSFTTAMFWPLIVLQIKKIGRNGVRRNFN